MTSDIFHESLKKCEQLCLGEVLGKVTTETLKYS